jgi:hypothetical protein
MILYRRRRRDGETSKAAAGGVGPVDSLARDPQRGPEAAYGDGGVCLHPGSASIAMCQFYASERKLSTLAFSDHLICHNEAHGGKGEARIKSRGGTTNLRWHLLHAHGVNCAATGGTSGLGCNGDAAVGGRGGLAADGLGGAAAVGRGYTSSGSRRVIAALIEIRASSCKPSHPMQQEVTSALEDMLVSTLCADSLLADDEFRTCSYRTIVLDIRPLTVRELAISTAKCRACGEQICNYLRTKTLMSTDCR